MILKDVNDALCVRRKLRHVVFTNGCFGLLHAGHLKLLRYCSMIGNPGIVFVAVDSDENVIRLKGRRSLIIPLQERLELVAALKPVDYAFPFDGDVEDVIRVLRPAFVVKGGGGSGVIKMPSDFFCEQVLSPAYVREGSVKPLSTTKICKEIAG